MADSTTNLDLISQSQAQKEVTANAYFDAASPASYWGRRAGGCVGLTWAYYGGVLSVAGTPTRIANGTLSLTASDTNYIEVDASGVVSANTTSFTSGSTPLYTVVCGSASATSWADLRTAGGGGSASVDDGSITNAKLANMAAHTFKGNNTASAAAPIDLTKAQLTAELNAFVGDTGSGGTKGMVPAPAAGDAAANKVLKADGTWVTPSAAVGTHTYTFASTVTVDATAYDVVDITLTGALTLGFTNGTDGKETIVRLRQDATGGRTLAFDTSVRLSTDIASVVLSTTAAYVDYIVVRYCSADSKFDLLAYNRGFH